MNLEKYLIDDFDDDSDIYAEEDLSTISNPDVREKEQKEARRRYYMIHRQEIANKRKIKKLHPTNDKEEH